MEIWRLMELKDITINNTCSSLMMQALFKGVYKEEAFSIMDFLGESRSFYPVLPLYNMVFYGPSGEVTYSALLQMQNLGLQPTSFTYDGLIRAVVSQRNFGDAMRMLKKMQLDNLKINDPTLATLSVTFSRELQLDLAESLLNQISKCLHPHPYNALLASCDALNQPERAVRVFAKMRKIKLLPVFIIWYC